MPTRHHVEIAFDEMEGMQELGYACSYFPYAAQEGVTSTLGRLRVIVQNAFRLIKIAKEFKPDIIYFNSRLEVIAGVRDYITLVLFKRFYPKPVRIVLKSHGSDMSVLQHKSAIISKVVLPYLKKNIDAWLFLSSEEKRQIVDNGYFATDRIFVTKNIVRTKHFQPDVNFKQRLNIPADYKILLFVGRLIKEKGIYQVLEAFAQVKDAYKTKLIVVGWGPEEDSLKQMALHLNITEQIIFTGFIPEQEVVPYYGNCDILVFPTFFPEGFPMALFNSVSAGMAIVTTPTRAATDYLSAPDNCLWAEPKNSLSVAANLQQLLQDDRLMADMKHNNLLKGNLFSQKQVCTELAETLSKITQS